MLITTEVNKYETNCKARQREYAPLTQVGLHKSGLRRRHRACYGSRTEHGMMAGTTPVHSGLLTVHNIIVNTTSYYLVKKDTF